MAGIRILVYLLFVGLSYARFVKDRRMAAHYLKKFGYSHHYDRSLSEMRKGIKRLQYFAGVIVTGRLDDATKRVMKGTRCGLDDPDDSGTLFDESIGGRYVRHKTFWKKRLLTWRYDSENSSGRTLTKDSILTTLRTALNLWEKVTNIKFKENNDITETPDIWFKFKIGRHGDAYRFDGPGGVLAHAFFPGDNNEGLDGDVHFDNAERFTTRNEGKGSRDLLWVATHELGHSLGLEHSHVQTAVMYPWYMGFQNNLKLDKDDVNGIVSLYGKKTIPGKRRPKPGPQPIPKYKRCPDLPPTAVWYSFKYRRHFFITKDQMIYSVKKEGIMDGPILLRNYFPKKDIVEDGINAVLQLDGDEFIFTTGKKYYQYRDFTKKTGPHTSWDETKTRKGTSCRRADDEIAGDTSPLKIIFRTIRTRTSQMDAAMRWQGNGKVYFFANDLYWKYDADKKRFACGYPRYIRTGWRGLPATIDAAHSSSKDGTFFTAGNLIYRFDDATMRVKDGYPKDIRLEWFKCTITSRSAGVGITPTREPLDKLQDCRNVKPKPKSGPGGPHKHKGPGGPKHKGPGGPKHKGHGGPKHKRPGGPRRDEGRGPHGPRRGGKGRGGPKRKHEHGGPKRKGPGAPKRKKPEPKKKKIYDNDEDCVNTDALTDSSP